jgi:hypothetical protein
VVKKEIDLFQQMAKTHSHPVLATYMQWYQDTITPLCDSRSSAVFPIASAEECKITDAKGIQLIMFMMPACYLGQHERVQFLAKMEFTRFRSTGSDAYAHYLGQFLLWACIRWFVPPEKKETSNIHY